MALHVIQGASRNYGAAQALASALSAVIAEGTVYVGYPVLATADDRVEIDALLVSPQCGLIAFLLSPGQPQSAEDWAQLVEAQDRLYTVLEGSLRRHESLRRGRRLGVEPSTVTILPSAADAPADAEGVYLTLDEVPEWISGLDGLDGELERSLQAALQRVTTIKPPKKRSNVVKADSRGSAIKQIERHIANLDQWQKAAAIESPAGPQRIRGLAGSGKTVVLALKAAYWHTQNPDWRIALTFQSRALYQQVTDLVTRFTFEHSNDLPDEEHMRVLHSWGSASSPGVYALIANALGEVPRNWAYANGTYGREEAFAGICRELLTLSETQTTAPIFDAVLIDEAQDLPPEFFQLVYRFTNEPKRIVWAYDELQKLSEAAMPSTDELFGKGPHGESLISLNTPPNAPQRDIVLPICYRNTPWALATAHALGTGIYHEGGLVQHPDSPTLWEDIGYEVVHGRLEHGEPVTLERSGNSYPSYFADLLTPDDAVVINEFNTEQEQDAWVAEQIAENLVNDELEHDDILIVLPDTYRAKSRAPRLMRELARHQIPSHLVGVNTSSERVFQPESVAIAHIHRAKGNEAPMVYAIDAQHAASNFNTVTKRNTLFTAITRSRSWVRITGFGERMPEIAAEVNRVRDNGFRLEFTVPTSAELAELRHIHRDRSESEEVTVKKGTEALEVFLSALDSGEMDILDLPPSLRTRLTHLREQTDGAHD
ncbi:DEAD/DEAH box helicase [Nocardioides cynanchi]|uniref:DEAD/DEAH box helicase n=1 Tax=Nocardioides cynanchi TaxID=2558918 RepID=UPI001248BEDB|nr:ATP-binding domain-containing protein [Nocardioides cynanchi]